jgi:hypothetical protein
VTLLVKRGGEWVAPAKVPVKSGGIWRNAQAVWAKQNGSWLRGWRWVFEYTQTANVNDANLRTLAVAGGWDQQAPLLVNIASGVSISAINSSWAFTVDGSFPNGVRLVNSGSITGKGGNGGGAGGVGAGGRNGLLASSNITIDNQGTIAGGGGGGGGGGNGASGYYTVTNREPASDWYYASGTWVKDNGFFWADQYKGHSSGSSVSHGGYIYYRGPFGGNEYIGSDGGTAYPRYKIARTSQSNVWTNGGAGGGGGRGAGAELSQLAGAGGGAPGTNSGWGGGGGVGGGLGANGAPGANGGASNAAGGGGGGAGGGAGLAIGGNNQITWETTGTRYGGVSP